MYRFVKLCRITPANGLLLNQKRTEINRQCWQARRSNATTSPSPKINFDELICSRRNEANRSVLVQVNSDKSYAELFRYCSQFGHIQTAHHYSQDESHYILLEYADQEAARAVVQSSTHNDETGGLVVQSPFLWFRAGPKNNKVENGDDTPHHISLSVVDGNCLPTEREVNDALRNLPDIGAQMVWLHKTIALNDIGTRLRFLAARQVEQTMHGIFPNARALPFGSSVNGFGRMGCDLDLILRLCSDDKPVSIYDQESNFSISYLL